MPSEALPACSHLAYQWLPVGVVDEYATLQALIVRPIRARRLCAADPRVLEWGKGEGKTGSKSMSMHFLEPTGRSQRPATLALCTKRVLA